MHGSFDRSYHLLASRAGAQDPTRAPVHGKNSIIGGKQASPAAVRHSKPYEGKATWRYQPAGNPIYLQWTLQNSENPTGDTFYSLSGCQYYPGLKDGSCM